MSYHKKQAYRRYDYSSNYEKQLQFLKVIRYRIRSQLQIPQSEEKNAAQGSGRKKEAFVIHRYQKTNKKQIC